MTDHDSTPLSDSGTIPVLPLRDVVVYPHTVTPLFVGRDKSVNALDAAMSADKMIFLLAQKDADEDDPSLKQVYKVGTLATILQLLKLPDGTIKVLIEGSARAKVVGSADKSKDYVAVRYQKLEDLKDSGKEETEAMMGLAVEHFTRFVKGASKVPSEILGSISGMDDMSRLVYTIAVNMPLKIEQRQKVLEFDKESERMEYLLGLLEDGLSMIQMEKRIRGRVKQQMEKSQREYYLNEQMKAIQKELGGMDDDSPDEFGEYHEKIRKSGMPKDVLTKAKSELSKLDMMSPMSAEATVVRNYLDWLTSVPWRKKTRLKSDLKKAEKILDEDHYGLEKVKERIIEYLAVQQRVGQLKGPILCLVGPPGVGKTSLGRSIARATGRQFTRMALGGVRDEAEIRGHRRTYIGAMPGKFVQNLSKVGVKNPLFLLDEVDKMAMDFRGDPASALLEVLDPEQNVSFQDHYLEVDFDLSDVMFICTANSMNIPPALLDRMEVIRLAGYTEDEKQHIAESYLIPRQMEANGLEKNEVSFTKKAVIAIIRHYTREAGVRNLEREIAKICRKTVKNLLLATKKAAKTIQVGEKSLEEYLGTRKFRYGLAEEENRIGQVTGLAWTEVGGELLTVEAAVVPGRGKLVQTGKLGDVMQESISAAVTVVRNRAASFGIAPDFYESKDIHVHVPEGATPKDGPSAGIAMCTAIVSELTRIPVHADVAMTGEITLRGEVLPIGGLKEKLIAALRGGIKTVLIPKENEKDLKEISPKILKGLDIKPLRWIDEVFDYALEGKLVGDKEGGKGGSLPDKEQRKPAEKHDWAPRH